MILLLLVANGIFAMSELALVSVRPSRLQERADRGDAKARMALELAKTPDTFLSATQIGITLIGILAGAFGGATIAESIAALVERIPPFAAYSKAVSVGIVVLGITYLSLVIGELVPKRVALNAPEQIAANVAGPMQWLSTLASPIVQLLTASTNLVLRVLHIQSSTEAPVTEEELEILIQQGTQAGVFEKIEQDMMTGVLRLGDQQAGAIMTHRIKMIWLDVNDSPDTLRRKIVESGRSRFPVAQGSLDNILGIVQAKDLLARCLAGKPPNIKVVMQPPLFVPETTPVLKIISLFRQSRTHIALVIDEYGELVGMITLDDILEGVVGALPFADEQDQPSAIQREDGSWLVDGRMPVVELEELLHIELPQENRSEYRTLGGFVMTFLGRVPSVGDHLEWNQFCFEIMDMDSHRVDKVLVTSCPRKPLSRAADD